jgi:hypothetical protein
VASVKRRDSRIVRNCRGESRSVEYGADVEAGGCAGAVGAEETAGVEGAGLAEEM